MSRALKDTVWSLFVETEDAKVLKRFHVKRAVAVRLPRSAYNVSDQPVASPVRLCAVI